MMMSVSDNLDQIQERIKNSALRVGRNPDDITLIAVTKFVEIKQINEAISWGISDIAENRVQEGARKFPLISGKVRKHLIGTLQTNKVKTALEFFDLIHSVDRLSLLDELAKQAAKRSRRVEFLIQLNISGEESKHGLAPDDLDAFLEKLKHYSALVPCGLMTMAPRTENPESVRPIFRRLRELFQEAASKHELGPEWRYLSMGMSQDYPVAVEEGANLLRVGSAIFKG